MRLYPFIAFFVLLTPLHSQSPSTAPLPERFDQLEPGLVIDHFPSPVFASTDPDRKDDRYYWKHNTAVLSPREEVEVLECGAYLYYNNQWNIRVRYSPKEFARLFKCRSARLKAGQPYTFVDNWRIDTRLSGGWAMWYVIGRTDAGKEVYGVGKLETVGVVGHR